MPREVDYVPPVSRKDSEIFLRDPKISFKVNPNRSKLFNKKRIIFLDIEQFDQNSALCKLAGADTILLDMECAAITSEDIVIKPTSVSNKEMWTKVTSRLTSLSMKSCPLTDLYLAIVHCSTEHYCNPTRSSNIFSLIKQKREDEKGLRILAPDSQEEDESFQDSGFQDSWIDLGENKKRPTLSAAVTRVSLLRPSITIPRYVEQQDPNQLGKPVENYKKFRKQQIECDS